MKPLRGLSVTAWGLASKTLLLEVKKKSLSITAQNGWGLLSVSLSVAIRLLAHFPQFALPVERAGLSLLLGIQALRWQADLYALPLLSHWVLMLFNLIFIHIKRLVFKDITVTHPRCRLVPGMAMPVLLRK